VRRLAGLGEVPRERAVHLVPRLAVDRLQRLADAAVEAAAGGLQQAAVRHLLHQPVAEPVLRRRAAAQLDDQVEPHQLRQRRHHLLARQQPLEQRQAEAAADRTGDGHHLAGARRQAVEARLQRPLDHRRDHDLTVRAVEDPAVAVLPAQGAALDQVLQRLLQEEGVAAGALGQRLEQLRRQLALRQRRGQLAAGTRVEWPQLDLPVAVRIELAGALAQPPRRALALRAVQQHQPQLRLLGQGQQLLEQLQRGGVGPLQVVDGHAQRLLLGQGGDDVPNRGERLGLDGLAAELAQRGAGLVLERHAEQAGEERVRVGRAAGQGAQGGLQLQAHAGLGGVGGDAEPVAQQVAHGPVGDALRVGARAALEEAHAIAGPPARLGEQPGLADARLAGDRDDRPAALRHRLAGLVEHRQLGLAPDQRHLPAHVGWSALAGDLVGPDRSLDPPQLDVAERAQLEARLHLAGRLGPHDHAAGLGLDALQARGHVDGVAQRVVALAVVGVALGQHHGPAVDRHAHGEIDAVAAAHLVGVGGDGRLDREGGPHAALGVVLVAHRRPEQRQQAVAGELRDGAVVAAHLPRHQRDDLVEEELGARRAEPLADGRRADDVGHGDGHDPLGAGGRRHGRVIQPRSRPVAPPGGLSSRPVPRLARRIPLVLAALAVVALAAAPAQADRAGRMHVLAASAGSSGIVGGVTLDASGAWVAAWGPRGAGTLRIARQRPDGIERRVVQAGVRGLAAADVELTAGGEPQVVWADASGIRTSQPFADGGSVQLTAGRGQGARIVRLADGRLAIYAAVRAGTRSAPMLAVGEGHSWVVRRLPHVAPVQPYAAFDLAARSGAGVAMLRTQRGRLRLETLDDAAGSARPSGLDLGMARAADGQLASVGGVVHVLYGGIAPGARAGSLRYGTLNRAGRFGRRVLLRRLQCDAAGNQVGLGVVGSKIRLLYGYGCDVGWSVATTAGRTVLDPFRAFPRPAVQAAYFAGSAAGRIAVVGVDARGRLGLQVVSR
jgi:hypothetical protein